MYYKIESKIQNVSRNTSLKHHPSGYGKLGNQELTD